MIYSSLNNSNLQRYKNTSDFELNTSIKMFKHLRGKQNPKVFELLRFDSTFNY